MAVEFFMNSSEFQPEKTNVIYLYMMSIHLQLLMTAYSIATLFVSGSDGSRIL
jgi:hypothetical protein